MKKERRLIDSNIKSMDLMRFKSEGLTPYYFNREEGKNFGLIEFTKPLTGNDYNNKTRVVFLLTPDEYDKIKKLSDNIKEMIELKMNAIKLYKQYIPGSLMKIIEEK